MYTVPQHLDKNKIFLVKRSELVGRIDAIYYNSVDDLVLVNNSKYPIVKLGNIVNFQRGRFGHRPRNDPRFFGGKYPFIQTGNVVEASSTIDKIKYNQTLNDLGLNTSKLFPANTLVITIAANIGNTAILDYDACFPDSLVALVPKVDSISLEYLNFYLRIIRPYIESLTPQAAQKNINNQQLSPLPIVLPPKEIQQQIVDIYNTAYTQKQAKEAKAKELLVSIDVYLLKELGITLPEKDNSLDARIFTTKLSEVVGGRFDAKLYDKTTTELKEAIVKVDKTKFKTKRLKDVLLESVAGDWGIEDEEHEVLGYTKCLVIRATEFNNDYNLSLDNSRVKYRLIENEKLNKLNIKKGDLLIEKSGGSPDQPVGRIALITEEELSDRTLAYSNFIHKITIDNSVVNPNYLFSYLKTIHNIKLTEAMQSQTNGIRNLIMSNYLNQEIVLPINAEARIDLEKQNEIASHISEIRTKAQALQDEAKTVLEEAKQQVEQIILGDQ